MKKKTAAELLEAPTLEDLRATGDEFEVEEWRRFQDAVVDREWILARNWLLFIDERFKNDKGILCPTSYAMNTVMTILFADDNLETAPQRKELVNEFVNSALMKKLWQDIHTVKGLPIDFFGGPDHIRAQIQLCGGAGAPGVMSSLIEGARAAASHWSQPDIVAAFAEAGIAQRMGRAKKSQVLWAWFQDGPKDWDPSEPSVWCVENMRRLALQSLRVLESHGLVDKEDYAEAIDEIVFTPEKERVSRAFSACAALALLAEIGQLDLAHPGVEQWEAAIVRYSTDQKMTGEGASEWERVEAVFHAMMERAKLSAHIGMNGEAPNPSRSEEHAPIAESGDKKPLKGLRI